MTLHTFVCKEKWCGLNNKLPVLIVPFAKLTNNTIVWQLCLIDFNPSHYQSGPEGKHE